MGLLDKRNEDVVITRKMGNGASVTYKSPQGSQVDLDGILGGMVEGYAPSPVADNVPAMLTPGEFVLNQPASQNPQFKPMIKEMNDWGRQQLAMGGWTGKYANGGPVDPMMMQQSPEYPAPSGHEYPSPAGPATSPEYPAPSGHEYLSLIHI